MKFKLIKPNCENTTCYGQEGIKTGDVVEFTGHLIQKARANPNYQEVRDKKPVKKDVKK